MSFTDVFEFIVTGIYFLINLTCLLYSAYLFYIFCGKEFIIEYVRPMTNIYRVPKFGILGVFSFGIIYLLLVTFLFLVLFTLVAYLFGFPPEVGDFWLKTTPSLQKFIPYTLDSILGTRD